MQHLIYLALRKLHVQLLEKPQNTVMLNFKRVKVNSWNIGDPLYKVGRSTVLMFAQGRSQGGATGACAPPF